VVQIDQPMALSVLSKDREKINMILILGAVKTTFSATPNFIKLSVLFSYFGARAF
jgi:hypothetical protein